MRVTLVSLCFVVVGCVTASSEIGEARMSPSPNQPTLHSLLLEKVQRWSAEGKPATLDAERTKRFEEIASWLAARVRSGDEAELLFVCTHNSRRSHMSQLWAQAAAYAKGLKVKTHSAVTETTTFTPRAVKALQAHGIKIVETGEVKDVRKRRLAANIFVTNLTESEDAFRTLYDGHPRRVARPAA
jgi:hypothetical protein